MRLFPYVLLAGGLIGLALTDSVAKALVFGLLALIGALFAWEELRG